MSVQRKENLKGYYKRNDCDIFVWRTEEGHDQNQNFAKFYNGILPTSPLLLLLLLFWLFSLVIDLFFLVLLLNQRWSPPFRLQVSLCITFRIMCDIPSLAVVCNESVKCFLGVTSKFFLMLLVTVPVAPIITGIIVHFRFHIHCISIPKLLYFNFFSASFCTTFLSAGISTSISVHFFSFLF